MSVPIEDQLARTGIAQVIAVPKHPSKPLAEGIKRLNLAAGGPSFEPGGLITRPDWPLGIDWTFKYATDLIPPDYRAEPARRAGTADLCTTEPFATPLSGVLDVSDVRVAEIPEYPRALDDIQQVFLDPGAARTRDFELMDAATRLHQEITLPPIVLGNRVGFSDIPRMRVFGGLGVILGTVDLAGYKALTDLKNNGELEELVAAPEFHLLGSFASKPADFMPRRSWGLEEIGIRGDRKPEEEGRGVVVGQIGGRVDNSHPSLSQAVSATILFDALGRPVPPTSTDGFDRAATHTAGTICGRPVGQWTIGVAPAATLASASILGWGNVVAQVLTAMNWAIIQRCRVLFLPLTVHAHAEGLALLLRRLRVAGILPVTATGDQGPGATPAQGLQPQALSVGACTPTHHVALFSSSQRAAPGEQPAGSTPRLVAPGEDILSCLPGGGYGLMSGTAMAAAHVAGVAALLFGAHSTATPSQIEEAILSSARCPATMNPELCGVGVPDVAVALDRLERILGGK